MTLAVDRLKAQYNHPTNLLYTGSLSACTYDVLHEASLSHRQLSFTKHNFFFQVNEDLYIIPSPKPDTQYAPAPANHVASRTQYDSEPQYAQDSQYEQYEQPDQPYQGYLQDGF